MKKYFTITLLILSACTNANSEDKEKEKFIDDLMSKYIRRKGWQRTNTMAFGMLQALCQREITKKRYEELKNG